MAVRLRTFDFEKPSEITSTEKIQYPWDEWLDGDIWQLSQGEDFQTHPLMMERIIRTRAVTRGAKVRLRHQPIHARNGSNSDPFGLLIVQRTDKVGPAEAKKAEAKAKRDAKRSQAKAEAEALIAQAGIQPKKVTAKKVSKTPSKRPVKKVTVAA